MNLLDAGMLLEILIKLYPRSVLNLRSSIKLLLNKDNLE